MVKKVLNLSILAGILLGVAPVSLAMSYEESYLMLQPEKRKINVTDSHGNQVTLSHEFVMACDALAGAYAATTDNKIDLRGSKEIISDQTLTLLEATFNAGDKEAFLAPLSAKLIKNMYLAEQYLGISSLRYQLAKAFGRHFPTAQFINRYTTDKKYGRRSIASGNPATINISLNDGVLDLSNQQLESLKGIERFPVLFSYLITTLNISGNPIRSLNLDKLFKLFPNLKMINAEKCSIKKIKLSKKLPLGACLLLAHNQLETVPVDLLNAEDCFIDLSHNKLPQNIVDQINKMKPNFFQKHRAWGLEKVEQYWYAAYILPLILVLIISYRGYYLRSMVQLKYLARQEIISHLPKYFNQPLHALPIQLEDLEVERFNSAHPNYFPEVFKNEEVLKALKNENQGIFDKFDQINSLIFSPQDAFIKFVLKSIIMMCPTNVFSDFLAIRAKNVRDILNYPYVVNTRHLGRLFKSYQSPLIRTHNQQPVLPRMQREPLPESEGIVTPVVPKTDPIPSMHNQTVGQPVSHEVDMDID